MMSNVQNNFTYCNMFHVTNCTFTCSTQVVFIEVRDNLFIDNSKKDANEIQAC